MKAEFVPESEYLGAKKMKFNSDKYYLQLVSEDGVSSTMYFDFENVLGINPYGADKSKLKWFYGSDSKNLKAIDDSTAISFTEEGKYIVQCELNGIKAKTTVIVGCDVIPDVVKFSVADKINVPLKEITDTRVKFITDSGNASSVNYRNMTYISEDSDIAEVDAYGFIYAKKKGKVKVYSIYRTEDGDEIYRTTLITVGNALPDQVKIKSLKRPAKNKIKLTLYKAKGAKGYQIAVYKTESDAAANKKAVLKKYTSKKSVTLKSSKFKKCKKLYIKVRTYNMKGKTKQYSEWVSNYIG
jgi:hypothetical protein